MSEDKKVDEEMTDAERMIRENMKKNEENKKRVARERAQDNKNVKRQYRLEPKK